MNAPHRQITLADWDERYAQLTARGLREPSYGGPLRRHLNDGDFRLDKLRFDNSPAAHRLWNFLLSEEDRLRDARHRGHKLVGAMKDLGTVPVMATALPNLTAFYPDGAWWIPCVMELSAGLLDVADRLGIDDSFCPVRAMLGAFVTESHFPLPDLLICSVGATCDDFSAIAQRLPDIGHPVFWWEMPHRRLPSASESAVPLPGGQQAPLEQVEFVKGELDRIRTALERLSGESLTPKLLKAGIEAANHIREMLHTIRTLVFTAPLAPLPALELLIVEMLAIHFCSDRDECVEVLADVLAEVQRRVDHELGFGCEDDARVFWVNPVADLRAMNLLESCGARLCGTDFLFTHALDPIPADLPPLDALARGALADPMVGSADQRAERIIRDMRLFGAQALIVSRIPGASHCALEGHLIAKQVHQQLDVPVLEIEVPPLIDAFGPALRTRVEALVETVRSRQ